MKTFFKRLSKTVPPTVLTEVYQDFVIKLFGSTKSYDAFEDSLSNYEQSFYGNVSEKDFVYLHLNSVRKKILLKTSLNILLSGATFLINLLEMLEVLQEIIARHNAWRFRYGWLAGLFGFKKPPKIIARRFAILTSQIADEIHLITYAIATKLNQWQHETANNISLEDFFQSITLLHTLMTTLKNHPSISKNLIAYQKETHKYLQELIPPTTNLTELAADANSWYVGRRIRVELLFNQLLLKRKVNLAQGNSRGIWQSLTQSQTIATKLSKKIIRWWHKKQARNIASWQQEIVKAKQELAEHELQQWLQSLQQGEVNLAEDLFWLTALPSHIQAACHLLQDSLQDPLSIKKSNEWVAAVKTLSHFAYITSIDQQDIILKNIIKARLIPQVINSQSIAYQLIYDYLPNEAYKILNPDEQMVIGFLCNDVNWVDAEQGKKYLEFLLGINFDNHSNLHEELEHLAQNLITRHWLVQPLPANGLLRLHNLMLVPSLYKSLLQLSTQSPSSLSQLISDLKSISSKLVNSKQWTQLMEKTYYLFKHLLKLLHDADSAIVKSAQQTLNELAYAVVSRFSADLYPLPTTYLKEIVSVLSELACIDPSLQQLLHTINTKWSEDTLCSPTLQRVTAQLPELQNSQRTIEKSSARQIFDQLRKSISILSTMLSQSELSKLTAIDLPDFIFSAQQLNKLIEFVASEVTEQQRSFITDTLPQICSARCLSDPLRNKLLLLADIFSPTISSEQKYQLINQHFDKQSARILSARLACTSELLNSKQHQQPQLLVKSI